ncbi:DUF4920 domain-containing protein [bacterium]|nr:DUF4920 domain-containing protein [bacterium]
MKFSTTVICLLFSTFAFAKNQFGAPITLQQSISVDKAVTLATPKGSKDILIEAKVGKVCKKKGCWMSLDSKSGELRVTFKDYDFFVPLSLIGKKVLVQGSIQEKQMSLKETKHYVSDEGGDPSKVTEPKKEYRIIASGVKVNP